MADLIEFVVIVKGLAGKFSGLGVHSFYLAPRIGEFVTFNDENGVGQAYKVKAVIHPLESVDTAGDLILEHVGTDVEFRQRL